MFTKNSLAIDFIISAIFGDVARWFCSFEVSAQPPSSSKAETRIKGLAKSFSDFVTMIMSIPIRCVKQSTIELAQQQPEWSAVWVELSEGSSKRAAANSPNPIGIYSTSEPQSRDGIKLRPKELDVELRPVCTNLITSFILVSLNYYGYGGFYAMAPYKLNKLPHNDYAFRVIVILGVLLTGCGGSSGQSTQPTQALGQYPIPAALARLLTAPIPPITTAAHSQDLIRSAKVLLTPSLVR